MNSHKSPKRSRHRTRSQVPDLIYGDYRDERVAETKECFHAPPDALPPQFRRITLFTTYRCNLDCVYCKTIRRNPRQPYPAKDRDYDSAQFTALLAMLSERPVRHIHFTGGEATLVPDLPDMVRTATQSGILCSTTSNGAAAAGVYERLVEAGIAEIRISLDSHVPEEFNRIVRRPDAYARVIATIRRLTQLRDRNGGRPFVIINMCVGPKNRRRIAEFVRLSLALEPDDIKLITMVQARHALADFPQRDDVVRQIDEILGELPPRKFPLLRYKLRTVFAPEGLGLKDVLSQQLMGHCFIPLTERTLDTTYYYPCSVYLREGGRPLGRLDEDDVRTQQRKIVAFVRTTQCRDDPICREYCISCCKRFNLFANWKVNKTVWGEDGERTPIATEVNVATDISRRDVEIAMQAILTAKQACPEDAPPVPFLVIKPHALEMKKKIRKWLASEGVAVKEELEVPDWNRVALSIYCEPVAESRVRRGLLLARGLSEVEPTSSAALIVLGDGADAAGLRALKKRLRDRLGPAQHCLVRRGDELAITALNHVHVPDPEKCAQEFALLMNAVRNRPSAECGVKTEGRPR